METTEITENWVAGERPEWSMAGGEQTFNLDVLKRLVGPDEDRSSIVTVLRAAEAMDYETHISSLDWEALRRERRPSITRMLDKGSWGDYVLVLGIIGDEAILVNAGLRLSRMPRDRFCRCWSGWVMVLHRRSVPGQTA